MPDTRAKKLRAWIANFTVVLFALSCGISWNAMSHSKPEPEFQSAHRRYVRTFGGSNVLACIGTRMWRIQDHYKPNHEVTCHHEEQSLNTADAAPHTKNRWHALGVESLCNHLEQVLSYAAHATDEMQVNLFGKIVVHACTLYAIFLYARPPALKADSLSGPGQ